MPPRPGRKAGKARKRAAAKMAAAAAAVESSDVAVAPPAAEEMGGAEGGGEAVKEESPETAAEASQAAEETGGAKEGEALEEESPPVTAAPTAAARVMEVEKVAGETDPEAREEVKVAEAVPREAENEEAAKTSEGGGNGEEAADGDRKIGAEDDANEINEVGPEEIEDEGTNGDDAGKYEGVEQLNDDGDDSGSEDDDAENDEVDPSLCMPVPVSEMKNKEIEIFVGGLSRDAVEEDITKVFCEFGEIECVKIVKHPVTQKSKGFAFVRYANIDAAKKALAEFKDGTEVKGKRVGISASQDNNTLYLGNICKTWTKDQVLNALKVLGIEEIEHILLPDDPNSGERTKGFAFLEFTSHSDAMAAFHRLRKPDAVLGRDRSAKVAFAQTPINPSEELLMKVKTVYLEHVPLSWDEEKIKESCKIYGEIQKIQLFRKSNKTKKKDFAFVEFSSRESALACVEGINNAQIGDKEIKVYASLARPLCKGRLAKQGTRGGYKVNSGEATEEASQSKKKAKGKKVDVKKTAPPKLPKGNKSKHISQDEAKQTSQKSKPFEGKKRNGRSMSMTLNERPSKKARNNRDVRGRPSNKSRAVSFGNPRAAYAGQPPVRNMAHTAGTRYANQYQGYRYAGNSGSNIRHYDLEPHAGYLPAANRVQSAYSYEQRRTGPYDSHQISGSAVAGGLAVPQTSYSGYTSYPGYQAGYAYPPPSGPYPGSGAYDPRRAY